MISLAYGNTALALDTATLPPHDVLLPRPPAAIGRARFADAFIKAVTVSDSAPPLAALAARARSACIVVSDKTRNHGQALLLPPLLSHLHEAGISGKRITVLIGNGTHENHSDEEKAALLGRDVLGRVRVSDHDADDPDAHVFLGVTPAGTPVSLNRLLADADLKIITGGVTHHYYAGFTGGRKGIMPGCAARATIEANHSRVLQADGTPHPRAATGVLQGNPVHEDMLAAARMAGNVFLINAVTGDHGAPAALFAGDLDAAHAQAVALARACYEVSIEKQYDCVIAGCGGAPRDMSFYQAHKSYNNAFAACRPGGTIILVAECAAGLGPHGFADWFALGSPGAIAQKLRARYAVPGQTAMATLRKAAAVRTILVSALPPAQVRLMAMEPADSLHAALAMLGRHDGAAAVMPQAAYTVPAMGA